MEVKINHQKVISPSGCIYQRGFNINSTILSGFLNYLDKIKNKEKDHSKKLFLNSKFEKAYNFVFMNLTQTGEFIRFMDKNKLKYNKKRANLKANGYLIINRF